MTVARASKVGEFVVNDIPSKYECSKIISDLIKDLPDILSVKIPTNSNLGFVAASQNAPDSSEAVLWVELNGAGVPQSIRYFIDGSWKPLVHMLRTPQWFNRDYLGNKDSLEAQGYVLADGTNGGTDLTHLFKKSGDNPTNYSVFAMYFTGKQILPNP